MASALALLSLLLLSQSAAGKREAAQASWAEVYDKAAGRSSTRQTAPEFCVVVRTYWGHGARAGDGGLRRLLRSLQRQSVQS